ALRVLIDFWDYCCQAHSDEVDEYRRQYASVGDGELRYLALCLVLLTGPGVLAMESVEEVLPARQVLTVVADGLDRCLDPGQAGELLALAARMCVRGHIRLVGTVRGPVAGAAEEIVKEAVGEAVETSMVDLGA
ncbi:hypothetical protein AB0K09_26460, partial [Streptomyces sp. NPDC049577]